MLLRSQHQINVDCSTCIVEATKGQYNLRKVLGRYNLLVPNPSVFSFIKKKNDFLLGFPVEDRRIQTRVIQLFDDFGWLVESHVKLSK